MTLNLPMAIISKGIAFVWIAGLVDNAIDYCYVLFLPAANRISPCFICCKLDFIVERKINSQSHPLNHIFDCAHHQCVFIS
mmetsp:Transcript_3674/g.8148  ORF Transcript_3674/g.8148 Transcript_3674/m.8148 type:complete len:81 (-) Transcript_3674:208-450(-)